MLCIFWITNRFTCFVASKPVKQEVSRTVILPLTLQAWIQHLCLSFVELWTDLHVWSHPNQSNRRSAVQWYSILLCKLGFRCFAYVELQTDLHVWSNPNQSNRRSSVQWSFPLQSMWVFSASTNFFTDLIELVFQGREEREGCPRLVLRAVEQGVQTDHARYLLPKDQCNKYNESMSY